MMRPHVLKRQAGEASVGVRSPGCGAGRGVDRHREDGFGPRLLPLPPHPRLGAAPESRPARGVVTGERLMMEARRLAEESRGTEPSEITRLLALTGDV